MKVQKHFIQQSLQLFLLSLELCFAESIFADDVQDHLATAYEARTRFREARMIDVPRFFWEKFAVGYKWNCTYISTLPIEIFERKFTSPGSLSFVSSKTPEEKIESPVRLQVATRGDEKVEPAAIKTPTTPSQVSNHGVQESIWQPFSNIKVEKSDAKRTFYYRFTEFKELIVEVVTTEILGRNPQEWSDFQVELLDLNKRFPKPDSIPPKLSHKPFLASMGNLAEQLQDNIHREGIVLGYYRCPDSRKKETLALTARNSSRRMSEVADDIASSARQSPDRVARNLGDSFRRIKEVFAVEVTNNEPALQEIAPELPAAASGKSRNKLPVEEKHPAAAVEQPKARGMWSKIKSIVKD